MQNLFDASDRDGIVRRVSQLTPGTQRRWGKMDAAQMLAHCAGGLEMATCADAGRQKLLGMVFGRWAKATALGEKPFAKNLPTDSSLKVADPCDLARERSRLEEQIGRFAANGPDEAARHIHVFFGPLTAEEWGVLMWKHLDHHLRQFGV